MSAVGQEYDPHFSSAFPHVSKDQWRPGPEFDNKDRSDSCGRPAQSARQFCCREKLPKHTRLLRMCSPVACCRWFRRSAASCALRSKDEYIWRSLRDRLAAELQILPFQKALTGETSGTIHSPVPKSLGPILHLLVRIHKKDEGYCRSAQQETATADGWPTHTHSAKRTTAPAAGNAWHGMQHTMKFPDARWKRGQTHRRV